MIYKIECYELSYLGTNYTIDASFRISIEWPKEAKGCDITIKATFLTLDATYECNCPYCTSYHKACRPQALNDLIKADVLEHCREGILLKYIEECKAEEDERKAEDAIAKYEQEKR